METCQQVQKLLTASIPKIQPKNHYSHFLSFTLQLFSVCCTNYWWQTSLMPSAGVTFKPHSTLLLLAVHGSVLSLATPPNSLRDPTLGNQFLTLRNSDTRQLKQQRKSDGIYYEGIKLWWESTKIFCDEPLLLGLGLLSPPLQNEIHLKFNNLQLQEFKCFPQFKRLTFKVAKFCEQKKLISIVTIAIGGCNDFSLHLKKGVNKQWSCFKNVEKTKLWKE